LRALSKRYGINQKTVAKWKKRSSVSYLPTGPTDAKSTVLSVEEEAIIVAFRRHTLLPLDDCLYALDPAVRAVLKRSTPKIFSYPQAGPADYPHLPGGKPEVMGGPSNRRD
jgi:transposase-like protein